MKLARFSVDGGPSQCGLVDHDSLIPVGPGDAILELAMRRRLLPATGSPVAIDDVDLQPPVPVPTSLRVFCAYEAHARAMQARRGFELAEEWFDRPSFTFGNPGSVVATEEPVIPPKDARQLDFGLCIAAVVGHETVGDEAGAECIAGFAVMNDWADRDIELRERALGQGPAKGTDFATTIGPWMVTPDELPGWRENRPTGATVARVNGREVSRGEVGDMHPDWDDLVVHAASGTRLQVGDVLAAGPVSGGALVQCRDDEAVEWLRPGDVVELEIAGLGSVVNTIGA